MLKKLGALSPFFLLFLIHWSCNKPSDLSNLLEGPDPREVGYAEIGFITKTVVSDSIKTYDDSTFIPTYFLGRIEDPIFGVSYTDLHFQVGINTEPDFTGAILDSVVLSLEYDTTRQSYGPVKGPISFEVYELDQDLVSNSNYYSSTQVRVKGEPIATVEGVIPDFNDTVMVVEPGLVIRDTVSYRPHLRVRLDRIGRDLIQLTPQDFASVEIFVKKFKGLSLRALESGRNMAFLEMFNGLTRINLYYTQRDTFKLMRFPVLENRSVLFNTHRQNGDGSIVQETIKNGAPNDSLIFIQGMQGPEILIEMTDLQAVDDKNINYAQLQLYQAVLPLDDTVSYSPATQLLLFEKKADGTMVEIADLLSAPGNQLTSFFGGNLDRDDDLKVRVYTMNITRHLRKVLRNQATTTMVVTPLFKGGLPNRSVLFGKSTHPLSARISITHTNSN